MPRKKKLKDHEFIEGDCLKVLSPGTYQGVCDLVIADPPYEDYDLINRSIAACKLEVKGPMFFFMYAEDLCRLKLYPEQVLFWTKPVSTKNTTKKYSRFVEVIACYQLDASPFNQDTHWSTRSGIFTDTLGAKQTHPFEKPVSLMEKLLLVNATKGQRVLDPFAGSESVRRAAENLGIKSLSIEIEP